MIFHSREVNLFGEPCGRWGELLHQIATLVGQADGAANKVEGRLIFEYIRHKSDLFRILLNSQGVMRSRKSARLLRRRLS